MGRVRTKEEVEEIKIREKIKFSLVRQQINLNRELSYGGCPTARGKVYITGIFQKNGKLSLRRPQLALRCMIRAHLNEKDIRSRRRGSFDATLDEAEIREYCVSKEFRSKCRAYRRFVEEAISTIVKREPDEEEAAEAQEGPVVPESADAAAPESPAPESPPADSPAPESPASEGPDAAAAD